MKRLRSNCKAGCKGSFHCTRSENSVGELSLFFLDHVSVQSIPAGR